MRQIRSADPWSTFLAPSGRGGTPSAASVAAAAARAAPPPADPAHPPGGGDDAGDDACRRVLDRLRDAREPLTLEQIRRTTRLGLLQIADAVETLRDRGLVAVDREPDEVVRLAGAERA